jgi:hypothetical protein
MMQTFPGYQNYISQGAWNRWTRKTASLLGQSRYVVSREPQHDGFYLFS